MSVFHDRCPILCVGDLVADIVSSPLPRLPDPGGLVLTDEISVFPGGNALNTAVALRRLGESVAIAGSIGDDALGDLLLTQVKRIGLDTRGIRREARVRTASTFILRAEGEDRRFIHALGAGAAFTGEHVSHDLIPYRSIVLIGGYLKLGAWDDDVLMAFLTEARRRSCRIVLNVCIVQDSDVDPRRCLAVLRHVDAFVPNQDEARILTGETELPRQARALREAGAHIVVITRGDQGLYADDGDRSVAMGVFSVPQVDPSGCGDCFTAGLVAALARDWDLRRALEFGSALGALGVTALGCTSGVPSFAEVERFLTEHPIGK